MIEIKIDPKFENDPDLLDKKAKLEIAFAEWECDNNRTGYIILSHDPESRVFKTCKDYADSAQEFMDVYNKALHPHSDGSHE